MGIDNDVLSQSITSIKRVWNNLIKEYGSTQDVIDGPRCMAGWVSSKKLFLLTFNTVFMLTYWMGGSEKVQKCADVTNG